MTGKHERVHARELQRGEEALQEAEQNDDGYGCAGIDHAGYRDWEEFGLRNLAN